LEDTSVSRIGIHAFSAEDAVSVLEKLAQLPDKHDFVWTINLDILQQPDLIRHALECLPTTIRWNFMFFGKSFKLELCSLLLAPRGSGIRPCIAHCRLRRNAQVAFLQAIRERENTNDHLLCLRLNQTYFERHIFVQILSLNKVDRLKLDYLLGQLLHNECIQALT